MGISRNEMGTPARVLAPGDVRRLQARADRGRYAVRDRTIAHLSFKAGLRACEIAGLDWSMVLARDGRIGASLMVADGAVRVFPGTLRSCRSVDCKSARASVRWFESSPLHQRCLQPCRGYGEANAQAQPVLSASRQNLAHSLHYGPRSHHPIWFMPRYHRLFEDSVRFAYSRAGSRGVFDYASDINRSSGGTRGV